jgi:hypothetical protein
MPVQGRMAYFDPVNHLEVFGDQAQYWSRRDQGTLVLVAKDDYGNLVGGDASGSPESALDHSWTS